mmetsp:Transcript_5575/g.6063  ORF Transcript_5575/g.6063 Transcript_5575/m.6063 type:complete len:168 (-) Transcript_5575:248-751(-)|eukprot:CAMPEP_0168527172 /NCGR_PEP_ID=MMETSP0405-20121227/12433_1 /TAXON_ID=498012 /ORGANISM="Trichosphaerium sp, Strain Am-I-7 wt" /LENGTH=167 /DNA_ID=CAMNT_0008550211 /DNA_START=43 /DNA_END=546 /DNA_ORIENTATION=-
MTAQVETPIYNNENFIELKRELLTVRERDPQPVDIGSYNREKLFDMDDLRETFYNYTISFLSEVWRHEQELAGGQERVIQTVLLQTLGSKAAGLQSFYCNASDSTCRTKTRWQEVAESLFKELWSTPTFEPSTNKTHLRALTQWVATLRNEDQELAKIVEYYINTLR